jgi:hypothetical protein
MFAHYRNRLFGEPADDRRLPPEKRAPQVFSRAAYVEQALQRASRPGVEAVAGSFTFGLRELLPADARWMTILRDPVERTLSQYFYLVRPPGKRDRAGAGLTPAWLGPPGPDLTLEQALSERSYIPDNLQVRMLCGTVSPFDPLPPDALERAIRNIDSFAYVGTTERFVEFLALLNLELGWPTVGLTRSNANRDRPQISDLAPEEVAVVEERNELDRQLHQHAASLFASKLAAAPKGIETEIEVLRESFKHRGPSVDARTFSIPAQVALARAAAQTADVRLRKRRAKIDRTS